MHIFLNVPTCCAHVFALALAHNTCPLVQTKNNESAPLNNKQPLGKQTSESDQQNVHSGQTQTFISKMPNGLSRFPIDFNMACWTAAKGKLSPRSIHKNMDPPPRSPPLIEDSKESAVKWHTRFRGTSWHLPKGPKSCKSWLAFLSLEPWNPPAISCGFLPCAPEHLKGR